MTQKKKSRKIRIAQCFTPDVKLVERRAGFYLEITVQDAARPERGVAFELDLWQVADLVREIRLKGKNAAARLQSTANNWNTVTEESK